MILMTINSVNAEQWIYIDRNFLMLDLDSLEYNVTDDSVSFLIKQDDRHNVYIHKAKYLYKDKQFALIESSKYHPWVAPENKTFTKTYTDSEFKSSQPKTRSELIEMIISNKKNIDYLKKYAETNKTKLQKKLAKQLKEVDEAKILFWINGNGIIDSYEFLFGDYSDSPANIIAMDNNLIYYTLGIMYYPEAKNRNTPTLGFYKKTLNISDKKTLFEFSGAELTSAFIIRSQIPNMPSIARSVYEASMPGIPDSSFGKLSNKDFYNTFVNTMTNNSLTNKQKYNAITIYGIQNSNYNENLNKELKKIKQLKLFSKNYTRGKVGIVLNLK